MSLAALLLGACSGGERLTRANFQERANKECEVLRKASDSFAKAQAPTARGDEVTKYLGAGADELRRLVERVDELAPPEEMEDGVDELLEVLGDYADGLDSWRSARIRSRGSRTCSRRARASSTS